MNDIALQAADIRNIKLATNTPIPAFMSVDANNLSFRKIQAAAEPILAKLRNTGRVKEVNWVSGEQIGSTALSLIHADAPHNTLFFGSVFISVITLPIHGDQTNDVNIALCQLQESLTPQRMAITKTQLVGQIHGTTTEENYYSASVTNTLIESIELPTPGKSIVTYCGLLITMTDNFEWDIEEGTPMKLGIYRHLKMKEYEERSLSYEGAQAVNRASYNGWDGSPARQGFPAFLKPKKVGQRIERTLPYVSYIDSDNGYAVCRAIPGTIIPKNFVGYLQHAYANNQGGGSQYTVPANPTFETKSLAHIICDIVRGVRAGAITLGTDPKRFVIPSFNFNEPNVSGYLGPESQQFCSITLNMGFDPLETGAIALNRLTTNNSIMGNAQGVVSPFYPLKTDTPPTDIDDEDIFLAYDLVEFTVSELSVLMTPKRKTINMHGQEYYALIPFNHQRADSQYAFGFTYPDPIISSIVFV